jgi:hypothetical protein
MERFYQEPTERQLRPPEASPTNGKPPQRRQLQGMPVTDLLSDKMLDTYGYLLLPFGIMQTAGSATQTVAAIRSHWGRRTFADERTIAAAACLDESTVRRRHLPKLFRLRFLCHHMIESRLGHRREWFFTTDLRDAGYWTTKSATLPRWAALLLPEWSHRAIFATVLQRSLATSRGSQNGPVPLEIDAVISGNCGRHNFTLKHLGDLTGLGRHAVLDAKTYLLEHKWLIWEENLRKGQQLYINGDLVIPATTLQEAHTTTRSMMFRRSREGRNAPA